MRLLIIILGLLLITGCTATSVGKKFDDSRNESLAKKRVSAAYPELADANIRITSFEGIILVTGQVPSANFIPLISAQIRPLRNVRKLHNELIVAGEKTFLSGIDDSWLATKVKAALSSEQFSDTNRIKVVAYNGVIYLMGLVTRAEADIAVEEIQKIKGVQKIVKILEYMN